MSLTDFLRPSLVPCHLRALAPPRLAADGGGRRRRAAGAGALEAGTAGARARARRQGQPLRGAVAREGGGGAEVRRAVAPWVCPAARPRPAPRGGSAPWPVAAAGGGPGAADRAAGGGGAGPWGTEPSAAAGAGNPARAGSAPPAEPRAPDERGARAAPAQGPEIPDLGPREAPRARPRDPRPGPGERRWPSDPGLALPHPTPISRLPQGSLVRPQPASLIVLARPGLVARGGAPLTFPLCLGPRPASTPPVPAPPSPGSTPTRSLLPPASLVPRVQAALPASPAQTHLTA